MRTKLEFFDDTTNMIAKLSTLTWGLARQGLNQAGSKVAAQYRQEIENEPDTNWAAEMFNGKKFVTLSGRKKNFGDMYGRNNETKTVKGEGGGNLNIKHLVKFYLPPKAPTALYVVVAGGHPAFRPAKFVDGVEVGSFPKLPSTGKVMLGILEKLEHGDTTLYSKTERMAIFEDQNHYIRYSAEDKRKAFKKIPKVIEHKARHFSRDALNKSKSEALRTVSNLYEKNFPKAVNNLKKEVRETRIVTA